MISKYSFKVIHSMLLAILSLCTSCCFYEFSESGSQNSEYIGRVYLASEDIYIYGMQASGKEKNTISHYEIIPYRVGGWEYRTTNILRKGTKLKIIKVLDTTNFQLFFKKKKKAIVIIENGNGEYNLPIRIWMEHLEEMTVIKKSSIGND